MASALDWLLLNIARASRWRGNTPDCTDNSGHVIPHCNEGGVDIPLPGGTPIYALYGGPLMGAGTFIHGDGSPGYGVVTVGTPVGQVYYQHIDIDPAIPGCLNGQCSGYVVQPGQRVGTSRGDVGEIEVGINATWGGVWGTNRDPKLWPDDPRPVLTALAQGVIVQTGNITCESAKAGSCKDCKGGIAGINNCPPGEQCVQFNSDGSVIPCITPLGCKCVTNDYASAHTPAGVISTDPFGSIGKFFSNLTSQGYWLRIAKGAIGVILILVGLLIAVLILAGKVQSNPVVQQGKKLATAVAA